MRWMVIYIIYYIANIILTLFFEGISVMATDEANATEEKHSVSPLIQTFCKERVESMTNFFDQIMVRQS